MVALSSITFSLVEKLRKTAAQDAAYRKLIQDVEDGVMRTYWLEDEFVMAKGKCLYVLMGALSKEVDLRDAQSLMGRTPQTAEDDGAPQSLLLVAKDGGRDRAIHEELSSLPTRQDD